MKKRLLKSDTPAMAQMDEERRLPVVIHDYSDVTREVNSALSRNEICDRMGINRTTIDDYREDSTLIGLPNGKNEFVYPAWQLDESGKPIPEIRMILDSLNPIAETPREKMVQLLAKSAFYEGKSIKDFIEAGDFNRAIDAARMRVEP